MKDKWDDIFFEEFGEQGWDMASRICLYNRYLTQLETNGCAPTLVSLRDFLRDQASFEKKYNW